MMSSFYFLSGGRFWLSISECWSDRKCLCLGSAVSRPALHSTQGQQSQVCIQVRQRRGEIENLNQICSPV